MTSAQRSAPGGLLAPIRRFQTNAQVRAAERAYLVVFLGGFYVLALTRLVAPYSRGPVYSLLTTPVHIQVALTVVVPFGIILFEWLTAFSYLRDQPGYHEWSLSQRRYVWLEITSEIRDEVTQVYLPLLPVALFWALATMFQSRPYWPVPTAIFAIVAAVVYMVNRHDEERKGRDTPPGTDLDQVVRERS